MGAARPQTPGVFQVLVLTSPLPENCTSILNLGTGDSLERDIEENLGDFWDATCEVDEAYEEYDQLYCDFDHSMNDKYGCSYFEDYLVRKALEETREYQDFLEVFMSMYIKDYENWWRERYNSK